MIWRAARSECGTLGRLEAAGQHQTTPAFLRFRTGHSQRWEARERIETPISNPHREPGGGNPADPTPGVVADLKNLRDRRLRLRVPSGPDRACVLVFDLVSAALELHDRA